MIGENLKKNENVKPNSREMEKLKENFPQFFTKSGEFKIDLFNNFLNQEEVQISKEGYELNFLGKSFARYISGLESETYLSPDTKHNSEDINKDSENLYIVGDNIDGLKHLLKSYSGKIKCIYIDPPYNTGSDGFVYPDKFEFKVEELAGLIGITEEEAERILNLTGKSNHSAWLTFMYPRLILARDLLSDDGVIFISIDDNEQANLKLMCDEIFGEENLVSELVWANKEGGGSSDSKHFRIRHEYILCYGKNKSCFDLRGLPVSDIDRYREKDNHFEERGPYQLIKLDSASLGYIKTLDYGIVAPDNSLIFPNKDDQKISRWRWSKEKLEWGIENDYVVIKKDRDDNWSVYTKQYLNADNEGNIIDRTNQPLGIIDEYSTTQSNKYLNKLIGKNIFKYSKPYELIKFLIDRMYNNSITLDFFSGSATTADAVMQLNAEDGGNRKYIMVQLPEIIDEKEPAYKAGYRTIDEIGRERIKRAAKKIKDETGADIDYGFKLFYLEEPENKLKSRLENFVPEINMNLDDMVGIFDNDHSSGKEAILSTWLNEDGYGLNDESEDYVLDVYKANLIGNSLYIIDKGLKSEDVMELIRRIENSSLNISRVVIYVHSVDFTVLQELRKNLKVLKNNKDVSLIERF